MARKVNPVQIDISRILTLDKGKKTGRLAADSGKTPTELTRDIGKTELSPDRHQLDSR